MCVSCKENANDYDAFIIVSKIVYSFFELLGSDVVLFVMLDTREAFHFSSGITLAQSGMAEVGRVIPDITCLIRSTCSE